MKFCIDTILSQCLSQTATGHGFGASAVASGHTLSSHLQRWNRARFFCTTLHEHAESISKATGNFREGVSLLFDLCIDSCDPTKSPSLLAHKSHNQVIFSAAKKSESSYESKAKLNADHGVEPSSVMIDLDPIWGQTTVNRLGRRSFLRVFCGYQPESMEVVMGYCQYSGSLCIVIGKGKHF